MNEFPEFFRYDAHSHLTTAVTGAYRLYDRRSDVRSLHTLLSAATADPRVPPLTAWISRLLIESMERSSGKLAILRHKVFAHTDLTRTYDEVFEAARITPFELRSLFSTALDVVNLYEDALGEPVTSRHTYPLEQLRALFRLIDEAAD